MKIKFNFGLGRLKPLNFWQNCPYSETKKWPFGCLNKNSKLLFYKANIPQNDEFHLEIKVLSVLSGFWEDI